MSSRLVGSAYGIGKTGSSLGTHQFDPEKLFGFLQKLVDEHPTRARATARKMGIDNLDEAMSILGQILNDP